MFFSENIFFVIMVLLAYLLGSVPFGYIIGLVFYKKNIQQMGSGNVGATNVWRVIGPMPAIATFFLDTAKGASMVLLCNYLLDFSGMQIVVVGLAVVVGHCYSYLLHFQGGKGVATGFGVLLAISPFVGAVVLLIWLAVFLVARVSSLAALTAWLTVPVLFYYFAMGGGNGGGAGFGKKSFIAMVLLTLVIFIRHKKNIIDLVRGREHSF
ncbi:MAG: glycerol-3-phosphate 1-O-acyltransferase PlsY [Hydrotalea sp.]|nr:glycerol-3-phosphate 1-O-acyltransferase PlsY [Hydrotalea sp.]